MMTAILKDDRKVTNMQTSITQAEYRSFQQAYDFFNVELFDGTLPDVMVTLQRHAKAYGYFAPERFIGRTEKEAAHELALNPDHFGRTDEDILSTLVHELVHVCMFGSRRMGVRRAAAITTSNGARR